MAASIEKSPDVTTESVFESTKVWVNKSIIRSDPACAELAEDESRAEEEHGVQDILEYTFHVLCGPECLHYSTCWSMIIKYTMKQTFSIMPYFLFKPI